LREWTWQGVAVPGLTFCVYSNNIGLLHETGAAHVYPQVYPAGDHAGAYRTLAWPLSPVVSPPADEVPAVLPSRPGLDPSLGFSSEKSGEVGSIPAPANPPSRRSILSLVRKAFQLEHVPVVEDEGEAEAEEVGEEEGGVEEDAYASPPDLVPVTEVPWTHILESSRSRPPSASSRAAISTSNRFSVLMDEGDDEAEEPEEDVPVPVFHSGVAKRATKLWASVEVTSKSQVVALLHAAGHLGVERWAAVFENELFTSLPEDITPAVLRATFPDCLSCIRGQGRTIRHDNTHAGTAVLREPVAPKRLPTLGRGLGEVVSIDLLDYAGADPSLCADGKRHIMTATDSSPGHFLHTIPLAGKDGVSLLIGIRLVVEAYKSFGHTVRSIRVDNAFAHLETQLLAMGVVPEFTIPDDSQTNGRAERSNQTVASHLRTMMLAADVGCPKRWDWALVYFVMIWNATSLVSPGVSAHTAFYHRKLDFRDLPLLPWGVRMEAIKDKAENRSKQDLRTESGFFVGISRFHFRGVLFCREDGTVLVRRSYWVLGDVTTKPMVETADLPDVSWTTAHDGLCFVPGCRAQEEALLSTAFESRDMGLEDHRGRCMRADAHAHNVSEEAERKRKELSLQVQLAASVKEAKSLARALKKVEQEQASRRKRDAKWSKQARQHYDSVMIDLRKHFRTIRAGQREAAELALPQGTRRSDRVSQANPLFAQLARLLPVDDACRAIQVLDHPAFASMALIQSATDLQTACVAGGTPCIGNNILDNWGKRFRAALAKGTPLEQVSFIADPKGWKNMIAHPKGVEFLKAVDVEMTKLESLGAGTEVHGGRRGVPPGESILRSSFVFVTKRFADTGEIEKYKARLVADGSVQSEEDTHAPTVGGTSLRILFAIAAKTGAKISKLDVESAFLIEAIDKPTYVALPAEYCALKGINRVVWKLLRSLYGLQQAPRLFWLGMKAALEGMGFRSSDHDPCIFTRQENDGTRSYIATHVDDCAVVSASLERNRLIRDDLLKKYAGVKWDDVAETFVGMAIKYGVDGSIMLSQPAYLRHILNVLGVEADGTTLSPVSLKTVPTAAEEVDLGLVKWMRLAVGLVQFLTMTRMEVSLPLNLVARCMHKPTASLKADMMRILRYLANRPDDGLVYTKEGAVSLSCWVDASWQSEVGNNSRTGFAIALGANSGVVQMYSKVQSYAALSSQHAEIIALTEAVRAVRHVRMLLEDMGYEQTVPTPVHEDNVGALAFSKGTCPLEKTKHIANRDRFCREAVREGIVAPLKIGTKDNPVNGLTKVVGPAEQEALRLFLHHGHLFAKRAVCVYRVEKEKLGSRVQFIS